NVSPNPIVGCVIVHEGKIIGEGYHRQFGGPHAEVHAVEAVLDKDLLRESTVYVTLEPCSHFGKTPPCADLLVSYKVKKVVICNVDPNPMVSGRGIDKLRTAGTEVVVGLLQEEGLEVNKRFFTAVIKKRPYIILKWAQTADGFVARENFDSKWISNQYSRQLVHKWRSEEDAILVGKNTAQYDNPSLTTRDWHGRNPIRVVIDRNMELNADLHLFDGSTETICFTEQNSVDMQNLHFVCQEEITPLSVLAELHHRDIQSVIIEGGSNTLQRFIDANLWDEARVFISTNTFGRGINAPVFSGKLLSEEDIFADQLKIYTNQ
ncbi:MAG: bifunctional diaminohydroxyphosphoribosylaminopyrimidine deaminase/5-amino-6-(5-phosphoribosylamino)uracil reductase RibD, partial [Marinoscillum sp.]